MAGRGCVRLSGPRSAASRTAFSISRCDVTPTFLRNLRTLAFRASSFMLVAPRIEKLEDRQRRVEDFVLRMQVPPFPERCADRYPGNRLTSTLALSGQSAVNC